MCTYTPHADVPFLLCQQWGPVPDLQLGKQLLPGALPQPPAPSWAPLAGAGEREPPQNATGLPLVCLSERGSPGTHLLRAGGVMEVVPVPTLKAWSPATATLSPPQSFPPSSGPGATPKCRLDFPGAPGAAFSLLFPVRIRPQPPPCSLSAGVGRAPRFPPLYKVPLPQAHYDFCRERSPSLSCLCLVLIIWGWETGRVKKARAWRRERERVFLCL